MSAEFDVAVVGGSLAGSAVAAALARAGAGVVVLEKSVFPRPKICGSFLSHEALPVLERMGAREELQSQRPETIARFALVTARGRRVESELPAPVLSLSRERLDSVAAAAAGRQGALIRFGTAVLSLEGNLLGGFRLKTGGAELSARVLIGAWGRYSPLDGRLLRPFFREAPSLIGFGKQLDGDGSRFAGRAVLHLFEGGYLGLSLVEGGRVNLAALATPRVASEAHHDFDELLVRLRRGSASLAADLDGLSPKPGPVLVSEPVHLGPHGSVAGDVLLAGDAAGVVDPYTGTGMALALRTGEAAAGPILDFLSGRHGAEELKAAHRRRRAEICGHRFLASRAFRSVFYGGVLSRLVGTAAAAPLARWAARLTRA